MSVEESVKKSHDDSKESAQSGCPVTKDSTHSTKASKPDSSLAKDSSRSLVVKEPGIFGVSLLIYCVMALVGLEIAYWFHKSIPGVFFFSFEQLGQRLAAVAIGFFGLVLISLGLEYFESFRREKKVVARLVAQIPMSLSLVLAVCSAIAEELLFRVGLQPFIGILLASLAFGALHLNHKGSVSFWTAWTVLVGLVTGIMFSMYQSFWPGFFLHVSLNVFAVFRARFERNRTKKRRNGFSIRI